MAGIGDSHFYDRHRSNLDSPFWEKKYDSYVSLSSAYDNLPVIDKADVEEQVLPKTKSILPTPSSRGDEDGYDGADISDSTINMMTLCAHHILSHPFLIIRRQCQVHHTAVLYHLLPFTLVRPLFHMYQRQGAGFLVKGIGSSLIVKGMSLWMEDLFVRTTTWPREIKNSGLGNKLGKHLLLKCSTLALVTPFYSSSLCESVQSCIASEPPGILDVFKDGLFRLVCFSPPQTGRLLPIWVLILPTVSHGVLHYIILTFSEIVSYNIFHLHSCMKQKRQGAIIKNTGTREQNRYNKIIAKLTGLFVADLIVYPLETIINRLHIQGTRCIIDNLDNGTDVIPIITRYSGLRDCYRTILMEEGTAGLFKGLGALLLQYAAQFFILKFFNFIYVEFLPQFSAPKVPSVDTKSAASPPCKALSSVKNPTHQRSYSYGRDERFDPYLMLK